MFTTICLCSTFVLAVGHELLLGDLCLLLIVLLFLLLEVLRKYYVRGGARHGG